MEIYKHIKTGRVYTILKNSGKMKVGKDWIDCIVYQNENAEIFVRESLVFFDKFKKDNTICPTCKSESEAAIEYCSDFWHNKNRKKEKCPDKQPIKVVLRIDADTYGLDNDIERIIDWYLPVIPTEGQCIFIDELIPDLPKILKGRMWNTWSVDWRFEKQIGICPHLWLNLDKDL